MYRMAVLSALYLREEEILYKNASLVTTATAACINLAIIFIMNYVRFIFSVYRKLFLTDAAVVKYVSETFNESLITGGNVFYLRVPAPLVNKFQCKTRNCPLLIRFVTNPVCDVLFRCMTM